MINLLKLIQIILFMLLIIPSICLILREPFIKSKKYKKIRLTACSLIFLLSMFIFMILSIIITYNDNVYVTMKYAPFIQSWIIMKSTLYIYLQSLMILIFIIGLCGLYVIICEKRINNLNYNIIEYDMPQKLSLIQKIKYPFMWYELYINVKLSKDGYYLLTDLAINDLDKFESKEIDSDA